MPSSAALRVAASGENVWISVFMTASGFGCCAAIFAVGVQAAALCIALVDLTRCFVPKAVMQVLQHLSQQLVQLLKRARQYMAVLAKPKRGSKKET